MSDTDRSDEPEVGQASLWFLRGVGALTVLVMLWFLVHAIRG